MTDASWRIVKSDEYTKSPNKDLQSSKVSDEVSETPKETSGTPSAAEPRSNNALKQIIEPLVPIGDFSIYYVQPDPLPPFMDTLQKLKHKNVDFVKIPINAQEDLLYLRWAIVKLIGTTGVYTDKIKDLIDKYNSNLPENTKRRDQYRRALLDLVNVASFFCKEEGVEFLRSPQEQ